jgi:GNAT superfamily N-acetyltransferase
MILEVNESMLLSAAKIHSESWEKSHESFCNKQFVDRHTIEAQQTYLRNEINNGKHLYMLVNETPVGIVSIMGNLIENLYVLPSEQHKGYGTELLLFAMDECNGSPCLWILDNNEKAYCLYTKHGFQLTGNKHQLSNTISEVEMKKSV